MWLLGIFFFGKLASGNMLEMLGGKGWKWRISLFFSAKLVCYWPNQSCYRAKKHYVPGTSRFIARFCPALYRSISEPDHKKYATNWREQFVVTGFRKPSERDINEREEERELGVKEVWMVGRHHLEAKGECVGECMSTSLNVKMQVSRTKWAVTSFQHFLAMFNISTRLQSWS